MLFMFQLDFQTNAKQHSLLESLLFTEKETIRYEENINLEEDISF